MFGLVADAAGDAEEVDAAIGRFRADVLHAVTETDASRAVVERNRHLTWPLVGEGIVRGDQPQEPGLLDLSRALRLRARTEPQATVVLPVWEERNELALVYAATFGDLTFARGYSDEIVEGRRRKPPLHERLTADMHLLALRTKSVVGDNTSCLEWNALRRLVEEGPLGVQACSVLAAPGIDDIHCPDIGRCNTEDEETGVPFRTAFELSAPPERVMARACGATSSALNA
jgi:hypothetical protein